MRNLEARLKEIEERIGTDERKPVLWFTPDTTFEQAKADYEKQSGREVTEGEFKKILPTLPKIVWTFVTHEGETKNSLVDDYRQPVCGERRDFR